jgi:hypothetical protein
MFNQGDTSCQNVQVVDWLRLHDIALTANHEKDLDNSASVAGLHPLCADRSARKLFSPATAPEGTITGTSGQAADPARPITRICPEKRWQSCTGRCLLRDHRRG